MEKIKINWILVLILLVGAFLRLYRIGDYMTFLGDEGRDVIIVRNLLVHADPILIGPGTSVGSMYLGPLYYYFMALFLFLSNFSPVGPSVGVALLGVATIYLVYLTGKDWFGRIAGLIASALYAISPIVILYSHSSWNPNIMPFFALLSVYSIWKVYQSKEYKWLLVTAISFAFVLQSHYLGVLLLPVLLIYWLKSKPIYNIRYTIYFILVFAFLMSPLLIFDIRHGFLNSKALIKFINLQQEVVPISITMQISKTYSTFEQINSSLLTAKTEPAGQIVTIILIISTVLILFFRKELLIHNPSFLILAVWLASGLIGFLIYGQKITDHYFGFLFPVPFLFVAFLLSRLYESKYKIFAVVIFVFLVTLNVSKNPLRKNPNNQMRRAQNVANKIIEISKNEPYNLAVLSDWNYEDGYEYFLKVENSKIIDIDSQLPETVTNQLLIICENLRDKCDPTHSAKAEVANFGWSKIDSDFEVDGVIIYKLIHSK